MQQQDITTTAIPETADAPAPTEEREHSEPMVLDESQQKMVGGSGGGGWSPNYSW